jgi:gamma-glutamylputrescine oxidase
MRKTKQAISLPSIRFLVIKYEKLTEGLLYVVIQLSQPTATLILNHRIKFMTVSYWQYSLVKQQRIKSDICIIGAGIAGASLAYWFNRIKPDFEISIIDAKSIGAGASGRNAGMILAGLADHYDIMIDMYGRDCARQLWQATLEHRRLVGEFLTRTNRPVDLEECGSWRLGLNPDEKLHLERSAALLIEDGFQADYREVDPLGRGFHGALGIHSDAGLHSLRLVNALIAESGAKVYGDCEAFGFDSDRDSVSVSTGGGIFQASLVVIALNAYAPLVHDYFKTLISPHRGQILVTAPIPTRILNRLVYAHHGYIYFRQLPDNRFLLGGWRHEFADYEAGYMDETTIEVQSALERFMHERFPETMGIPVETRWAGTMGFSKDGIPIIGTLPENSRIAFAVGFTGHGFGLALEVSRRTVRMLIEGESSGIFSVDRFKY